MPSELKRIMSEPSSIVAHQLRLPLSVIQGYIEVLASGDLGSLNKEQKEYLKDLQVNVERMKNIVSNFLDLSRIEEGKYEVNKRPFDLVALVESVVAIESAYAEAWGSKIAFEKPDALPFADGDAARIQQVVENMVMNAIRYSVGTQSTIELAISIADESLVFGCRDGGMGIGEEEKDKVFTKFFRSEKAVRIDPTGSGLGLFINKATVEQSGGKIWFENNADKGAAFYFSLPIAKENGNWIFNT